MYIVIFFNFENSLLFTNICKLRSFTAVTNNSQYYDKIIVNIFYERLEFMRIGIIRLMIIIPVLIIIFFISESIFKNTSDIIIIKSPNTDVNDDSLPEMPNEEEKPITEPELPTTEPNVPIEEPIEAQEPADIIDIEEPAEIQEPEEAASPVKIPDSDSILSTYPLPSEHALTPFIEKLIEIAESQPTNPQDEKGRTKYGEAFGEPYAQWCTEFVMWCLKETEEQLGTNYIDSYYPWKDSAYRCVVWYKNHNAFMLKDNYIPRRGDLIFFDYDFDENSDHTGMVTGVEYDETEDKIYVLTIEGNLPEDYPNGTIKTRRLAVDEKKIYGYGTFMVES
jgi:hypothetical protein